VDCARPFLINRGARVLGLVEVTHLICYPEAPDRPVDSQTQEKVFLRIWRLGDNE